MNTKELLELLEEAKKFLDCFVDEFGDDLDSEDECNLLDWYDKYKSLTGKK